MPTIEYVKGNIFEQGAFMLVNPVNCVGVMGAGLAKQFKERFPHMFEDYERGCYYGLYGAGELGFFYEKDNGICNFPTKGHWRENSTLEYIEKGLQAMIHYFEYANNDGFKYWQKLSRGKCTSIAFPKLGCGYGNLDWEKDVKPLFEKYLPRLKQFEKIIVVI